MTVIQHFNMNAVVFKLEPNVDLGESKECARCLKLHVVSTAASVVCKNGYLWFGCDGVGPDGKTCCSTLLVNPNNVEGTPVWVERFRKETNGLGTKESKTIETSKRRRDVASLSEHSGK